MKISVIIPAYNEEQCLPETLERIGKALSIAACPSEIIVVDNDSQDRTKQIAEAFGAKVFLEKEHNISKVRNTGVENATGDVLIHDGHQEEESIKEVLSLANTLRQWLRSDQLMGEQIIQAFNPLREKIDKLLVWDKRAA